MKNAKRFIIIMLTLITVLYGCSNDNNAQSDSSESFELSLAHISVEDYVYHKFALKFKELVEEKTDNVEIKIYPNSQLGDNREIIESLQFGNVDFVATATGPANNFIPEWGILDVPFMFSDWDHMQRFSQSETAKEILSQAETADLKALTLGPLGFRNVTNSKGPIETPDDMDGLKIRVLESDVYLDTFNQLGANSLAMPWGEAFTALQQGTIDAQENDVSVVYSQGVHEVQDYVSFTEHIFAFFSFMVSSEKFNQWPEEVQIAIEESAQEANDYIFDVVKSDLDRYEELLEEKGMELNEVDKDAFIQAVTPVVEEYEAKYEDIYYEGIFEEVRDQ